MAHTNLLQVHSKNVSKQLQRGLYAQAAVKGSLEDPYHACGESGRDPNADAAQHERVLNASDHVDRQQCALGEELHSSDHGCGGDADSGLYAHRCKSSRRERVNAPSSCLRFVCCLREVRVRVVKLQVRSPRSLGERVEQKRCYEVIQDAL